MKRLFTMKTFKNPITYIAKVSTDTRGQAFVFDRYFYLWQIEN